MKRKFIIDDGMSLVDGLVFDALYDNGKAEPNTSLGVVRFVFFNREGGLHRAMLSNNSEFYIPEADTSIIPDNLRFPDLYKYAALLSPYGYRSNTVGGAMELFNRCFGSYHFDLIPHQEWIMEVPDEVASTLDSRFISPNYEEGRIYTGQHGYHFSHSCVINQPTKRGFKYRIGVELEVEATSGSNLSKIRDFESNWFFMERDGSLNDYGVEFVTIPLLPSDAKDSKFWTPLCGALSPIANSWDSGRCGLHIHIGRAIFGETAEERSASIGKLLYLYHHYLKDTPMNTTIFGRDRGYHDLECKSALAKAVDILGSKILKEKAMCDAIDKELKDRSNEERYFDVNILNTNTVEFRRGKGSLKPERIAAVVEYCELLCKYARKVKWDKISLDHFVAFLKTNLSTNGSLKELMTEKHLL